MITLFTLKKLMRVKTLAALIFAFLIIFVNVPAFASHESGEVNRTVPLSEIWEYYTALQPVSFVVKECGFDEFQGGFSTGDLARAAERAAIAWESAFPGIQINLQTANCSFDPGFRNGMHEIYWAKFSNGGPELGDYMGFFLFSGEVVEHDISIDSESLGAFVDRNQGNRAIALYNLMLHELGHALGLGDAYQVDARGCDWSVMLVQCMGPERQPTQQDIAALQHIHGFRPQPSAAPTPQPEPPSPTPPPADNSPPPASGSQFQLKDFDMDGNGVIGDEDLFRAMDLWALGDLSDRELTLLVDAWISQVRVASTNRRASTLNPTAVEIFDTSGKLLASLGCSSGAVNTRVARTLDRLHAPKAVYITTIRDCTTNQTKITNGLYQG